MSGQRVFNGDGQEGHSANTPADAIYHLCKQFPAKDMPTPGMVRTEADGLSAEAIERICIKVEQNYRKKLGTTSVSRITIWTMLQHAIREEKRAGRLT
jgi:hypothetical protein